MKVIIKVRRSWLGRTRSCDRDRHSKVKTNYFISEFMINMTSHMPKLKMSGNGLW